LRTPNLMPGTRNRLTLLAFWDLAWLSNKEPLPGQDGSIHGSSAGLGLRFNIASNLIVRGDYGWQLKKLPGQLQKNDRGQISVVIAY